MTVSPTISTATVAVGRGTEALAFDPGLAERLREMLGEMLGDRPGLSERRMMGALVFLVDGAMICGVTGEDLLLRLGPEAAAAALAQPHVQPFRLGASRSPRSFVRIAPAGIDDDADLRAWLAQARPRR